MDEDIEYKIPETDGIPAMQQYEDIVNSAQSPNAATAKKPFKFLSDIDKRKIVLPLGIFIVIALAYKVFNFYGTKKTQRMAQQKVQMQNINVEPVTAILPKPSYPAESSVVQANNDQNYNTLSQKITKIATSVYENEAKLANLHDNVAAVQENIMTVDKNVKQVASILQQELAQAEQLKQTFNRSGKTPVPKSKKSNIIKYHIRAITPGRAWIESDNGKYSKTIKVGDELKGYGAVDYILPQEGIVLMSNGSYIAYGENDS